MANIYLQPLDLDNLIKMSSMYKYWEIRDQSNVLLIARRPDDGEIDVTKTSNYEFHNNPENLDFTKALQNTIKVSQGLFKFLVIKFGTGRTATKSHRWYQLSLIDDDDDVIVNNYGQPQTTPGSPLFGMPFPYNNNNSKSNEFSHENYLQHLSGIEEKFNQRLNGAILEMEMKYRENELLRKQQELDERERKLTESEELLKEKLEDKRPNWNKIFDKAIDKAPDILNGVKGYIEMFKTPSQPLAGTPVVQKEAEKLDKKQAAVSFKKKATESIASENAEESNSSLSEAEKKAIEKVIAAIKSGKVSTDEISDFAENPEEYFDKELEETKQQENGKI